MMYVYTILSVVGWVWCALFFVGYAVAVHRQKRRAAVRGFDVASSVRESKPNA